MEKEGEGTATVKQTENAKDSEPKSPEQDKSEAKDNLNAKSNENTSETQLQKDDTNKTEKPQNDEKVKAEVESPTKKADGVVTKKKIDVLLKAAGDAPIMKRKKWAVDAEKPVSYLTTFIKKYIKCEPDESLFIYVNQTFVPAPDQVLSNLFECFGTDGKLVLSYCKSQAWG